jgi:hypothetical protein
MKYRWRRLSLISLVACALPLTSCQGTVKTKSDNGSGASVSASARVNISTPQEGTAAECQQVFRLATEASSDARMLGLFLPPQEAKPNIDAKITEIKQSLDQLQAMPISDRTVDAIRSEYISMMQTALQPVEQWAVGKAESQRQQVSEDFVKQHAKASDFRIQKMFAKDCKGV